ncbi:MAG: hypothetical protein Q9222_005634 [Ikaeria aurantiellina]
MPTTTQPPKVLPCHPSHLPSCLEIYNHYALHTTVTFHTNPQPLSFLASSLSTTTSLNLPFLVAIQTHSAEAKTKNEGAEEIAEEEVLGYIYATPYRPQRPAYDPTAEITIFLSPYSTSQGIGPLLLSSLLTHLETRNKTIRSASPARNNTTEYIDGEIRELIAMVAIEQSDDVGEGKRAGRWYATQGFREVGVMRGVGWKFGRGVDVGVFQKGIGKR